MYPWQQLQDSNGRTQQTAERLKSDERKARGNNGKDHNGVRDTTADEPKYPGRRQLAVIKEDMNFRRYLYRGKENVLAQSVLLAIAYNINKLHFKIQGGRTGQFLTELKAS